MGRFIFFDIDETLAYPGHAPSETTKESIQAAIRNRHKVFISTGRTMDSIPLPITDIGFDGGIFSSGEISDFSVKKGRPLLDICEHFGCLPSACTAFGDSLNDVEILEAAGIGVAMGNAEPELTQMANLVCDRCENDGIAKTLHEFGLICMPPTHE